VDVEQLKKELRASRKHIKWLESEILRLKMLLEGKDVIMNSLPTSRDG
jgi:hypothetical protein